MRSEPERRQELVELLETLLDYVEKSDLPVELLAIQVLDQIQAFRQRIAGEAI